MSHEALSGQQFPEKQTFSGYLPTKSLRPTEDTWSHSMESGPAGQKYQRELTEHIAQHGFSQTGPIEVYYGKMPQGRKNLTHVAQGHHRLQAAKTLKLSRVPVKVETWGLGRPPELEDE